MIQRTKTALRTFLSRTAQAALRGDWYPILLPHHQVVAGGISTLGGSPRAIPAKLGDALALCDGGHTLDTVARESGVRRAQIIEQHDAEVLLLWPNRLPEAPVSIEPARVTDIILSPHLDDAFLSMGAEMLRIRHARAAGAPGGCVVLDVFSKVSWWRFDLSPDVLPRVQAMRDAEEDLVMRLAGAMVRRAELFEAPLRGYPLKTIFTADVRPDDYAAAREPIRAAVAALRSEFPCAKWHLPLGVGNHVDHRIAGSAALEVLEDGSASTRYSFYEDLPYAAIPGGVADFAEFVPGRRLRPEPLRGEAVALKLRLLRVYWSQLIAKQIYSVGAYARRVYPKRPGERSWVPGESPPSPF